LSASVLVLMGVAGCGKSTVGARVARELGATFLDADDFHPADNVRRMAAGTPLTDADRGAWLDGLAARLAQGRAAGERLVLACSALKRSYRDTLRRGAPELALVHLTGTPTLLAERLALRQGHYMPATLLPSQLATLEPPLPDENALTLDIAAVPDALAHAIAHHLENTMSIAPTFTQVILETGPDGRARWREQAIALAEGKPMARLSPLMPSGGCQLRESPVGFRSEFHCTETPQWVFILRGAMEIGLQDGTSRVFRPGEHFYSADKLPAGAAFDAKVHGHWSRQVGNEPLATLFVRS
jgi:carbohydrate kinase (thermoresistant glucokinase family)